MADGPGVHRAMDVRVRCDCVLRERCVVARSLFARRVALEHGRALANGRDGDWARAIWDKRGTSVAGGRSGGDNESFGNAAQSPAGYDLSLFGGKGSRHAGGGTRLFFQ